MNTTKLNKTTKKAQAWIKEFNNSICYSVTDFYGRCSTEKINAEKQIQKRMIENNCYDFRIINGNCSYFTCGYMSKDNKVLYIETAYNIFSIEL